MRILLKCVTTEYRVTDIGDLDPQKVVEELNSNPDYVGEFTIYPRDVQPKEPTEWEFKEDEGLIAPRDFD